MIMEYQKIINLLENTPNQTSKFRTKNWVEINDDVRGMYNKNSQVKFKTSILKLSLCDYSETYILVNGTITVSKKVDAAPSNVDKKVVFKNCAPYTDCTSDINNTQIDNPKDIHVVMPMYNLLKYSNNHSKISGNLWCYYRDETALTNTGVIANFHAAVDSPSFKFKQKIARKTAAGRTKDVAIIVPLQYLSSFSKTLEMPLINFEVNLIFTWPEKYVLFNDTKATTFAITDNNVSVLTLSTQDNAKLLQQLKSGFKRTINWKKN